MSIKIFAFLFLLLLANNIATSVFADSIDSDIKSPDHWNLTYTFSVTDNDNDVSKRNTTMIIEINREDAPLGSDHLYTLCKKGYFDSGNSFFRVVPEFVIQFGISNDPSISKKWENPIKDDPVKLSNKKGVMTFATAGPNTRTTQLYFNLADNSFLDKEGFAGIGTIVKGYEDVLKIYSKYGQQPDQGQIYANGYSYLKKNFPNLDYIYASSESA